MASFAPAPCGQWRGTYVSASSIRNEEGNDVRSALLADAERQKGKHPAGGVRADYKVVPCNIGRGDQFKPSS